MDAADLVFAGPTRQAELVAAGEVTPRELVDASLERIERLDPQLNAFRVVFAERARNEAGELGAPDGRPLFGVPVAVKDDQDVAGEPTCFGTRLRPPPAAADAEIVRRLRAAGAIVIGKTNVPELTVFPWTESIAYGITRNPWDLDRGVGGSSGGSACAVAAGLVGAATASDGLGSIRIPAAACGVVGLKAQKHRVPIAPKTTESGWYDLTHYGFETRSIHDTALLLDVVAGTTLRDAAAREPGRLRVGLSYKLPPLVMARLDGDVRAGLEALAATLRDLGHEVIERDPPYEAGQMFRGIARWFRGILHDAQATGAPRRLEPQTQGMARIGRITPHSRVERSLREEPAFAQRISRVFDDVDVLLMPVVASPPLEVGRYAGRSTLAAYRGSSAYAPWPSTWNFTGHPAISVPSGFTADGLPLAAQLVGRWEDEATLVSLTAQLEAVRRWTDRRPPIS